MTSSLCHGLRFLSDVAQGGCCLLSQVLGYANGGIDSRPGLGPNSAWHCYAANTMHTAPAADAFATSLAPLCQHPPKSKEELSKEALRKSVRAQRTQDVLSATSAFSGDPRARMHAASGILTLCLIATIAGIVLRSGRAKIDRHLLRASGTINIQRILIN